MMTQIVSQGIAHFSCTLATAAETEVMIRP
jgi:hypothetical protein